MHKFASEIIGKKVLLRQEGRITGAVDELVINPSNGEFLGLIIAVTGQKRLQKTLPEREIMGISRDFILIKSADSLGDLDDVVRIKNVLEQRIRIDGNRVYTVSNIYLGKVADYVIDLSDGKLSRIYVQTRGLSKIAGQCIVESRQIVSIKKERITVIDAVVKKEKQLRAKGVTVRSESKC